MRRLLRVIALPLLLTSLAGCAGGDVSLGYGYANPAHPYGYYAPG